MKHTIFVAVLLTGGMMAGCVDRDAQKKGKETQAIVTDPLIPVEVVESRLQDVPNVLELTGSITTDADVEIGAKTGGRLVSVSVREGDTVRAGQVIAQQETTEAMARVRQLTALASAARSQLDQAMTDARVSPTKSIAAVRASEARLRQAKSSLQKLLNGSREEERKQAEANVRRAKSDLDTAEKSLRRTENLVNQGALARADLEAAQNRYQSALAAYQTALEQQKVVLSASRPEDVESAREAVRAAEEQVKIDRANQQLDPLFQQRVDAARANLLSAQEQIVSARQSLADLTIRSSFSGRVTGKPLTVGTFAGPGTVIARIIGGAGVYYEAQVTEGQIGKIKAGLPVNVQLDALPGVVVRGVVGTSNPIASSVGRLFSVRVMLTERLDSLKPGMFARGGLQLGINQDAVTVPNEAILRDGESTYIFVAEGEKAKRKSIKLGIRTDGWTEVTGLGAGERVIVKGQTTLVDGAAISIQAKDKSATEAQAGA